MVKIRVCLNALACVLAALLLSGCAALGSLRFWDDDDEALAPMPLPDIRAEVALKREWSADVGRGLGERFARLTPMPSAMSLPSIVSAASGAGARALNRPMRASDLDLRRGAMPRL